MVKKIVYLLSTVDIIYVSNYVVAQRLSSAPPGTGVTRGDHYHGNSKLDASSWILLLDGTV